jgi:hypothetical protein
LRVCYKLPAEISSYLHLADPKSHHHHATEKKKKKKSSSGPKAPKKKGEGGGGKVVIMRMSRNKRKSVTVVTGLDAYPGASVLEGRSSSSPTLDAIGRYGTHTHSPGGTARLGRVYPRAHQLKQT